MTPNFEDLVAIFIADKTPQVWSLLVTVFGDLAQDDGVELSGALVSDLTRRMRVKPEASRVALHRLRKDNWINSRKQGRASLHRLSEQGWAETRAASPRIYAETSQDKTLWLCLGNPSNAGSPEDACVTSRKSTHLWLEDRQPETDDVFATKLGDYNSVPDWMRSQFVGPDVVELGQSAHAVLSRLDRTLGEINDVSPNDTIVLRVFVVHTWRRLILRVPELPDGLFPEGAKVSECRALKNRLLARLPKPPLDTLQV